MIFTIPLHFISLAIFLIFLRGRWLLVLTVLYSAGLNRRLHYKRILPFSIRITIGSVVLISDISLRKILAFSINYVSSYLRTLILSVSIMKSWGLLSWSRRYRGIRFLYWNHLGWCKWMAFLKLTIFQQVWHSCGMMWKLGFRYSPYSSFLH